MKLYRILLLSLLCLSVGNTVFSQSVRKVVIDAGHGGKDPGAIGATGLYEKNVALSVTLLVGSYIEQLLPEVEVIYTRDTDVFLELHERSSIANNNNADLFISIHANSAANTSAFGSETFVLGLHKSESNLEVAKRENGVIALEDNTEEHYNFDPYSAEGHIMHSIMQAGNLEQSIHLASNVQDQFTNRVMRKDRGVKQAGFYVLYKTTMPSILIELGFLSNGPEESYLRSDLGKEYMASAIYRAFRDYKEVMDAMWAENEANKIQNIVIEEEPEEEGMEYRIQVYASKYQANKNSKVFIDFDKVVIEDNGNGVFRHMVNSYPSYESASLELIEVVKLGYKGAYVVSYKDNERAQVYDVTTVNQ